MTTHLVEELACPGLRAHSKHTDVMTHQHVTVVLLGQKVMAGVTSTNNHRHLQTMYRRLVRGVARNQMLGGGR